MEVSTERSHCYFEKPWIDFDCLILNYLQPYCTQRKYCIECLNLSESIIYFLNGVDHLNSYVFTSFSLLWPLLNNLFKQTILTLVDEVVCHHILLQLCQPVLFFTAFIPFYPFKWTFQILLHLQLVCFLNHYFFILFVVFVHGQAFVSQPHQARFQIAVLKHVDAHRIPPFPLNFE